MYLNYVVSVLDSDYSTTNLFAYGLGLDNPHSQTNPSSLFSKPISAKTPTQTRRKRNLQSTSIFRFTIEARRRWDREPFVLS